MPEPTAPDPARGVPPRPPSESRRGLDPDEVAEIGYRDDHDPKNARKIAEIHQQAVNEQGARAALAQTPNARREAELIAKRESGQPLNGDEIQFLAQRRARREHRNT